MSSEEQSIIERRMLEFPEVLAEMPGDLAELADFLSVSNYQFSKDGLEVLAQSLNSFLRNADLNAIDEDQGFWLQTRLMYLIGELLNERHGGYWTVRSDPGSDFFGRYVVAGFRNAPDRLIDPAEAAHSLVTDKAPRDLIGVIDRLGASVS